MNAVAYVLDTFPSLSETFVLREVLELQRLGLRVQVLALCRPAPGPIHGQVAELQLAPAYAKFPAGLARAMPGWLCHGADAGLRARAAAIAFEPAARAGGVAHVHAHFAFETADAARLLAQRLGTRFSVSVHARDLFAQPAGHLRRRIEGAAFVAACTRQGFDVARQACPALVPERLCIVRHGVRAAEFAPAADAEPVLLAVGRLVPKKGFPCLLDSCTILRSRGIRFECRIVGEGPLRAALERQVAAAGLSGSVRLLGALTQEELRTHYQAARAVVVPSVVAADGDRDGVPNVILEAMAAGCPVVASRAGAIPEAVEDGVSGLLVPPGAAPALADALGRLLGDAGLRAQLRAGGRATLANDFDAARNAAGLAERLAAALQAGKA